jgi:predicted phage terminase large subunit-like protein
LQTLPPKTLDDYLNEVNYHDYSGYVPTAFALTMLNFIKLCTDGKGKEYPTPIAHLKIFDSYVLPKAPYVVNACARGFGKSTLNMYVLLYLAVYGEFLGGDLGKVDMALYIADSMENNIKTMRKNLQNNLFNSKFLRSCFKFERTDGGPVTSIIENEATFVRKDGSVFSIVFVGAKGGFRGSNRNDARPKLAILDDLIGDNDANSAIVMQSIQDLVDYALLFGLHPQQFKVIWSGTPFNSKDPFVKAIESGLWVVNVYPLAEKVEIGMPKEEFFGGWDTFHPYEAVMTKRMLCDRPDKVGAFNREAMLRIIAAENRLVTDEEIQWYRLPQLLAQKHCYNFYITTDFATSEKETSDFSVISVWAVNAGGDWYYVDGICQRQLLDTSIEDLFRLVQKYKPLLVGVEISGQQYGFVSWLKQEMIRRQVFFNFARNQGSSKDGILPNTNKMTRFMSVLPLFKSDKVYFPTELKTTPQIVEALDELSKATAEGFKSKHDDFIDTISMLGFMNPILPDVTPEDNELLDSKSDKLPTFWDMVREKDQELKPFRKSTLF